ncbi:MAG: bifunctional adenosylcobinamide kinase/adenosylcobinamide-phosphate guanylyltransferase [Proteobacteria bacterium]|nr:bifunctional adenosylcobinamide kinase/adenosylcobinamide-phosphate guanylyltransferase [Pseudomonadota bacterium]
MKQLILGGARSGKSALAQRLAASTGECVVYIATATADDEEMAARIAQHQSDRPSQWSLIEEPIALPAVLAQLSGSEKTILIDCLTLWLSNVLGSNGNMSLITNFIQAVDEFDGHLIMVSNEVGQGIVPMGELSRQFVDEAGNLHQQIAAHCDRVVMTVAGIPTTIKGDKIEV